MLLPPRWMRVQDREGLTEKPSALLFAFLKFALEQGYFDTAVRLHGSPDLFSPQQVQNDSGRTTLPPHAMG